jgi:hypothetical protein
MCPYQRTGFVQSPTAVKKSMAGACAIPTTKRCIAVARQKTNSKRIQTYLPVRLITVATRLAKRRGLTTSEIMRTALSEYLKRELEEEKANGSR